MRGPRVKAEPYALAGQLRNASATVPGEPAWPAGGPTAAELADAAAKVEDAYKAVRNAELELGILRAGLRIEIEAARQLMRRVDRVTTALYGEASSEKIPFGLRPIDLVRNRPPVPDAPEVLHLGDGPEPGSLSMRWKPAYKGRYLVEAWSAEPEAPGSVLVKATDSGKASCTLFGLEPGMSLTLRVRATAGGRPGPWSEPLSRYVNG